MTTFELKIIIIMAAFMVLFTAMIVSKTNAFCSITAHCTYAQGLQIIESKRAVDHGQYIVKGVVENNSTKLAHYVKIIGTFYDAKGKVVGIGFTYTADIYPGGRAAFQIGLMSTDDVANYTLLAAAPLWVQPQPEESHNPNTDWYKQFEQKHLQEELVLMHEYNNRTLD